MMTSSGCKTDKGMIVLANQSSNRVAASNMGPCAAKVIEPTIKWFKFDHAAPGLPASGNPAAVNS
jgi:hypothetical protein